MKNPVREMFDEIANRYDFLNHILSGFQDIAWRKFCCKKLRKLLITHEMPLSSTLSGISVLDMCGGTGDFAKEFQKELAKNTYFIGAKGNISKTIIGDFSLEMLKKVSKKKINANALQCDAMKLPFKNKQFHIILNGFGMRNISDNKKALDECFRVLEKGGFYCVLEFFSPRHFFEKFFYKILAPLFIPFIGKFFSKKEAYQYLVNSIIRFLSVKDFCKLAENSGFNVVMIKKFNGGISYGVFLQKPLVENSYG